MLPHALPDDVGLRFAAPSTGAAPPDVLSRAERERLATFGHPDRRLGFVLGRTAARELLAERLGCAPADVPLVVAPSGAPVVAGDDLHVSIAHAGRGAESLAAAAVAPRRLGLDLERIQPRRADLYQRILRPEEYALLDRLPLDHDAAQTLLWSLKEAVLKGLHTGLRRSTRSIHLVSLGDGRAQADAGDGSHWALHYGRRGGCWVSVALAEDP